MKVRLKSDFKQARKLREGTPHPTTNHGYSFIWRDLANLLYLCKLLYSEKKVEQVWEDPEFTVLNSFFDI